MKSKIVTVKKAMKSNAELDYWNNYIALKLNMPNAHLLWTVESDVREFNTRYQKEWLDRPINEYCDALVRYLNLLGHHR